MEERDFVLLCKIRKVSENASWIAAASKGMKLLRTFISGLDDPQRSLPTPNIL